MSMKQARRVVPPVPGDFKLENFSSIIQKCFEVLFQAAHVHTIVTSAPSVNDGNIGDIYLGDLTAGKKLYAKFSDGWYEVSLTRV